MKILIISGKKYRKAFDTQNKFSFNNKCLYNIINNLDIKTMSLILNYLEEEIDDKFKFVNLKQFSKIDQIDAKYFTNRQVYKTSEYKKDGYFSIYKSLNIDTALKDDDRITIISKAGFGKSELCKNIVNTINNKDKQFVFYFRLLNYTGETISIILPIYTNTQESTSGN